MQINLIFLLQMEDNLIFFSNGRRPHLFQMEEDFNFFLEIKEDNLNIFYFVGKQFYWQE
jgi:hypothetical protein